MDRCDKCAGFATHWVKDHNNHWWHTCATHARAIYDLRKEIEATGGVNAMF